MQRGRSSPIITLMRLFPVVLLVLICPALAAESESPADGIGKLVSPLLESEVIHGLAVGVHKDGKTWRFAYGKLPAGADSVFEIGSITKVFTGYLLADLVRYGTVRLDQPVRELLPEGTVVPKQGDREITLLDLATHRSGLPRMPSNFAPKDRRNPYADYDEARLFAYLKTARLLAEPGTKKLYSNLGMGLLGHALARKCGTTYEQLLAKRIAGPMRLGSTGITLTEGMKKRLAPGYNADLGRESNWDLNALAGAGAIRSTVGDMLTFLAAHFESKDGVPDLRLAWQTSKPGTVWHNGQTGGYHSVAIVVPEQKVAVVVLADTASKHIDDLGGRILRHLMGQKVEPQEVPKPVKVEAKVLETYVGRYRYPPDIVFIVSRDERGLLVQMPDQPKRRLHALSEMRFTLRVAPIRLDFEKNAKGEVTGVLVTQVGRQVRAPRVGAESGKGDGS